MGLSDYMQMKENPFFLIYLKSNTYFRISDLEMPDVMFSTVQFFIFDKENKLFYHLL